MKLLLSAVLFYRHENMRMLLLSLMTALQIIPMRLQSLPELMLF